MEESALAPILRRLPLLGGGGGFVGCLVNRVLSDVSPVLDSSSAQSRADVLVIVMSAALLLTGLAWLRLRPERREAVRAMGVPARYVDPTLPATVVTEIEWAWETLQAATGATAMVLVVGTSTVAHRGLAAQVKR